MLMTRDSMLNLYHLNSINNLKFINDLAAERHLAAEQLADTERKHKALDTTLLIVAILLVAMIPVLVVVVRRHRRLRKRYLELYRRTQLVLHAEEENRRRRETEMRALMLPSPPVVSAPLLPEANIPDSEAAGPSSGSAPQTAGSPAYIAPKFAISQKTRILAIMDETEEVYSPEFSLERLAELVEISPRALSSVLNNHLGTTFRDLLNQYRVRRACRLLSDIENYGYLTIEAIANNVGYKSRTSLTTAFKKEIGMAPSEYQRIARRSSSHPTA